MAHQVRADVAFEDFTESTALTGLSLPTAIAFLPDGRLVVTEMDGSLKLADLDEEGVAALTLAEIPVSFCEGDDYETGLLGLAVDPDFADNGYLYMYRTALGELGVCAYADSARENQVIRVTLEDGEGGPSVSLDSLTVILSGIRTDTPYHTGGCLRIGPDEKLYVSTGDTGLGNFEELGPGTSTNPYADSLFALEGKILRLELDGSVPEDNPFVSDELLSGGGTSGGGEGDPTIREEIFAYGFRNPWRMGFDPASGALWVGDVGEDDVEEIDRVASGSNHAWPRCEGTLPKSCKQAGDAKPAFTYPHAGKKSLGDGEEASVTGGAFAPEPFGFQGGAYFFADFAAGNIYRALLKPSREKFKGKPVLFADGGQGIVDLIFGPDANLYYVSFFTGSVRRIAGPENGGGQPIAGKSLLLKDGNKKALKLLAKDAIDLGGGIDNPVLTGGSLRVAGFPELFGAEGEFELFNDLYFLPASGWKLIGKAPDKVKGFKYTDKKLENGPISSVVVRDGKLIKITGKLDGLGHELSEEPDSVSLSLTLGTRTWCLNFAETAKFKVDTSYSAKDADAPLFCVVL
ncbi:MAG: hypothetical protein DHS20C15_30150 [Planctomycetota bacterium]|nr:MAG: hypothetical protein DHS20C15_30150 [Planctomycetota bacterium]